MFGGERCMPPFPRPSKLLPLIHCQLSMSLRKETTGTSAYSRSGGAMCLCSVLGIKLYTMQDSRPYALDGWGRASGFSIILRWPIRSTILVGWTNERRVYGEQTFNWTLTLIVVERGPIETLGNRSAPFFGCTFASRSGFLATLSTESLRWEVSFVDALGKLCRSSHHRLYAYIFVISR